MNISISLNLVLIEHDIYSVFLDILCFSMFGIMNFFSGTKNSSYPLLKTTLYTISDGTKDSN